MITTLHSIGKIGIKALIKERIKNPQKYVNTPLIIWRADIRDEVHEDILRDIFNEYNGEKSGRSRKWYKIASIHQLPSTKADIMFDMLSNPFVDKNNNKPYQGPVSVYAGFDSKRDTHEIGLFVIDPVLASLDYSRNPELLPKYHSVINSRKWGNMRLLADVPVVAYMCISEPWFETPEVYADAEQYIFFAE